MAGTILKLGYSNPLTDTFGAHPTLGSVLDLNDGVTFTLVSPGGLEIPAPPRTLVLAGNTRSQGEVATRAITRHNRTVTARLIVGPAANSAALIASLRTLLTWLASPPQTPITLQYQPFNASAPVYLDVVGAAHNLPSDEGQWLRGQFEPLTIAFTCRPGMRGDRVTLQNLVVNPGFEQPCGGPTSGAGITVFKDSFANANAYAVQVGSPPAVAANVMTIPAGGRVSFGSPSWGAIQQWSIRFQWVTGQTAYFFPHVPDTSNFLEVSVTGTTLLLAHQVAGTLHTLASAAITPTSGNWYWMTFVQFPSVTGNPPDVVATLFNDAAGALGSSVASLGPVPTFDAVAALSGQPWLGSDGASMAVGGAFSNVQTLALFGPGGMGSVQNFGAGRASGAWEGTVAGYPGSSNTNCYDGGPVASFGALRMDFPPAGDVSCVWVVSHAAPAGYPAGMPVSPGDVLHVAYYVKTTGLSATGDTNIQVNEYDNTDALLRQSFLGTTTGDILTWTQKSGSVTIGANTAYVGLGFATGDTTAGASANATVWFDNAQAWNETTTGQTTMPWCDLRAVVSPAQLVVSGLQGDLPAPCALAAGTYVSSLAAGGALMLYVGRKGITSPNAQLINPSYGAFSAIFSPQGFAQLDGASYGGFDSYATVGGGGWNPRAFSLTAADAAGVYHLLARLKSAQTVGNLASISVRVALAQKTVPWFPDPSGADIVGQWAGSYVYPFSQQNVWTIADAGQVALPPFPQGARTDPSQLYLTPRAQWQDTSGSSATAYANWQALLPVDGSLLVATVNNPTNSATGTITTRWLWTYADGLLVNRAGASDGPAWMYSLESAPTPNPARGAGGAGTQSSGSVNVNSGADPALILDPTQVGANATAGVNQMVAILSDQDGGVYPFFGEISYSPLYLEPR